jgi:O-antigen ligase
MAVTPDSSSGKFGNGSSPRHLRSGEAGPPWQVVLFVLLGGLGFFTILQFQDFLTKHLHSYRRYDTYVFLALLAIAIPATVYFYRSSSQAWQGAVSMVKSLQWWHWLWLIIFVSGLVFRKRTAAEGMEAPVDTAAAFRIVTVGLVGTVLLVKLFLRHVEWLSSAFRGIIGLLIWFDLMALLSTSWSVYAAWTFYKAVEYGVDVCLLAAVLVMATKSEDWKKFTDWTWILFGIMLVNVWIGCIWDPLDALSKGGIYGQQGIGELGVWLQGVFPDVSSNQIGEYAACLTALALCRLLPMNRRRENTAWYIFVFLFGFVTIIFAQTRSALGGFCIAVFLIYLLSNRVGQGAAIVISSGVAILVSGFWQTLYLYVQRGQGANAFDSLSGRIEWWEVALEKFSNYPFTGLGMWAAARFGVLAKIGYTSTATIHSDWVEITVGMGAWGLIPVLILMLMAWYFLVRGTISKKLDIYDRQLAYEGMAVLTVVTTRMFFMTDLSLHPPLHFFAALGAAEFLRRKYKKGKASEDELPSQLSMGAGV